MSSNDNRSSNKRACERAASLIADFVEVSSFGRCHKCESDAVPQPFRQLLDHHSHMTVTMESFYGQPVSLEVLSVAERTQSQIHEFGYRREITLHCSRVNPTAIIGSTVGSSSVSGPIVQYGIVGIALELLPQSVANMIRAETAPLGRILIEAGLHRRVHDVALLKIEPGPHLRQILAEEASAEMPVTYGRVATIDVDERPVISLLEVVAPPPCSQ